MYTYIHTKVLTHIHTYIGLDARPHFSVTITIYSQSKYSPNNKHIISFKILEEFVCRDVFIQLISITESIHF